MAVVLPPSMSDPLPQLPADDGEQYTRLHITPLDQSLLTVVIPSSVLPKARNISYHTIETFPEKRYGYVDLPELDAEKLKKKLNGSVLRGAKMRIEQARPQPKQEPAEADEATPVKKEKKNRAKDKEAKSKKRKRVDGVIEGIELGDRKIKRGWTLSEAEMIKEKREKRDKKDKKSTSDKKEKKGKKREIKSKYTDEPECLFKTKLPVVAAPVNNDGEDASDGKRKKRKSVREVVVHEFEKSTQHPTFLKATTSKSEAKNLTFEDGKGWVDENGEVVEPLVSKRPPPVLTSASSKRKALEPNPEDDETSSSGSSDEDDEDDEEEDEEEDDDEEEEEEEEEKDEGSAKDNKTGQTPSFQLRIETPVASSPIAALKSSDSARPKSSGSTTSLTIKIPPVTPAADKVHPLEALYKRRRGEDGTVVDEGAGSQPFSFFGNDDAEDDAPMGPPLQIPMTPFTKEDFDFRTIRSAAPTPDTAHPSRTSTFQFWATQSTVDEEGSEEEEEDNDEDANEDMEEAEVTTASADPSQTQEAGGGKLATSEFQKLFWEKRGDLNRAWKKRKKTVAKEKRYRENRARASRAI